MQHMIGIMLGGGRFWDTLSTARRQQAGVEPCSRMQQHDRQVKMQELCQDWRNMLQVKLTAYSVAGMCAFPCSSQGLNHTCTF